MTSIKTMISSLVRAVLLLAFVSTAWAQSEPGFFYRTGQLTDVTTGQPVEGVLNATFRFYEGSSLTADQASVTRSQDLEFVNGFFVLKLPYDAELLTFFANTNDPFFGIQLNGDDELRPLSPIAKAPTAAVADALSGSLIIGGRLIVNADGSFPDGVQAKLQGPAGADGATGPAGAAGAAGAQGSAGPMGPRGIAGATGPAGADGATGPAGADGATGPAGAAGAAGSSCAVSECTNNIATISCDAGGSVTISCIPPPPKKVFVTSANYTGDLGGLDGADTKCNGLAATAGLPGTFKAWLSDGTATPRAVDPDGTSQFVLTDETVLADSSADLLDGNLDNAINLNENGVNPGFALIWSGLDVDGTPSSKDGEFPNCNLWSSASAGSTGFAGKTSTGDQQWTREDTYACDNSDNPVPRRIYCFEQ